MAHCICPECGNPRVNLIWGDDMKWTGACRMCSTILMYLTKEEVEFNR